VLLNLPRTVKSGIDVIIHHNTNFGDAVIQNLKFYAEVKNQPLMNKVKQGGLSIAFIVN